MATQKKQIITALEELAGLYKSRDSIASQRNKALAPHRTAFDAAIAPHQAIYGEATKSIEEKFDKKSAPVETRIAALEKEISAQMFAKVDESGKPILDKVEAGNLVAEAAFSERREINPETFLTAAKDKPTRWSCVQILIGNAEKLLGKSELDKIAKKIRTWRVSIIKK